MMLTAQQYYCLNLMDVTLWQDKNQSPIMSNLPKMGASCLVLLHQKIEEKREELFNIFHGMLKVLPLNKSDYHFAWLRQEGQANFEELHQIESLILAINQYLPEAVLMLGSPFFKIFNNYEALNLPFQCQITYHPMELLEQPEKKRQAYQDLLKFKKVLDGIKN